MPASPTPYEQQREARIARNREVLAELGIISNPLSGAAQEAQGERDRIKRGRQLAAEVQPQQPARRSRRLLQAPPEHDYRELEEYSLHEEWEARPPSPPRPPRLLVAGIDDKALDKLDRHNVNRLRTMSDKALQTRIWRIKNVGKLQSFIKVLSDFGKHDLAAEAQLALQQLCRAPTI